MDEFYTQPQAAAKCWGELDRILKELGLDDTTFFIEPSAGDGAFYDLLPVGRRIGIDISPQHPGVMKADFLCAQDIYPNTPDTTVIVGNPPFGKRGKLAVSFFLKAAQLADTIGFIVPVIFRKYFIHKQLPDDFRLIYSLLLPSDSFRTPGGKTYSVNTEFQVWTRKYSKHTNLRLYTSPPISHCEFDLWQYNNTKDALKVFANPFDFAVPCQGWQDYSRRETKADNCEKHKQWMLLKANSDIALKRLRDEIDYEALALQNTTSTPGFRKNDLVQEYINRYDTLPPHPTRM